MATHELTFPIADPEEILKLRAGDEVVVQGQIIGIRDRTQIRIFDQGVEPPLDLSGAFLLHTAPNVRKLGPGRYEKICIGTTTSARMVRFTEGLGGDVTVLQCHVEHADTHMTLNPVAVNYQCWAARRATAHVAADGTVDFDREA